MQEIVLAAARAAGAEVRRGAGVRTVAPGTLPRVTWDEGGATHEVAARLVVGADGRGPRVRLGMGPAADARRARALPQIAADPSRVVDVGMSGPEAPHDDAARARFFGEA